MNKAVQGMTITKVLPYNLVLEKIRYDAIARNFRIRRNVTFSVKRKATDVEIIEMRRLREVEHLRLKEIAKLFPEYSYEYILKVVNYYIAASVGIEQQLKSPCVHIRGNQHSSKVVGLI